MHELMAKGECSFCQLFLWIRHLVDDVIMDDIIMATFNWLLLAKWHLIGKSEYFRHTRKTQDRFLWMKWKTLCIRNDEFPVIQDGIHALTQFVDSVFFNFFTISFCEFYFLAEALKNVLSWWFSAGWARIGRVTGGGRYQTIIFVQPYIFWFMSWKYVFRITEYSFNFQQNQQVSGLWYEHNG